MTKIIAISLLLLTGCDVLVRKQDIQRKGYAVRCVQGIVFVLGETGIAWLPDVNGLPVTCEE
jgi:hypothetical protein